MPANDIKQVLQTLAQDAPDTASLHLELVPRIRRRRRIRQTILTATVICGVGVVTAGVFMGTSTSSSDHIEPAAPASTQNERTFGACGSRIAANPDGLPLQLIASPPAMPIRATDDLLLVQIDIAVKNVSDGALKVMTGEGAVMAITKDGTVVASPAAMRAKGYKYTIEAGAVHDYKSTINLRSCDPKAESKALAPGKYQLHALQTFILLDKDRNNRTTIVVVGGPWDIEIGE
jgi:hypothetical protein